MCARTIGRIALAVVALAPFSDVFALFVRLFFHLLRLAICTGGRVRLHGRCLHNGLPIGRAHVCAVYCRFCFRREMVGPGKPAGLSPAALAATFDYIRSHRQIWEVILTGGDPLILSPRRLRAVMESLAGIDHVKVIRIHTRMPVAEPARVTANMVRAIKLKRKPTYVAVHVNHPRELTAQAREACARIADAGIPLLSQTVLLAGVNDTAGVMDELMRALVECRIKPYYLHHGDLAPGTGHLRTDVAAGQELMRRLRGRASGLCQPTYVLDIPGGHGLNLTD